MPPKRLPSFPSALEPIFLPPLSSLPPSIHKDVEPDRPHSLTLAMTTPLESVNIPVHMSPVEALRPLEWLLACVDTIYTYHLRHLKLSIVRYRGNKRVSQPASDKQSDSKRQSHPERNRSDPVPISRIDSFNSILSADTRSPLADIFDGSWTAALSTHSIGHIGRHASVESFNTNEIKQDSKDVGPDSGIMLQPMYWSMFEALAREFGAAGCAEQVIRDVVQTTYVYAITVYAAYVWGLFLTQMLDEEDLVFYYNVLKIASPLTFKTEIMSSDTDSTSKNDVHKRCFLKAERPDTPYISRRNHTRIFASLNDIYPSLVLSLDAENRLFSVHPIANCNACEYYKYAFSLLCEYRRQQSKDYVCEEPGLLPPFFANLDINNVNGEKRKPHILYIDRVSKELNQLALEPDTWQMIQRSSEVSPLMVNIARWAERAEAILHRRNVLASVTDADVASVTSLLSDVRAGLSRILFTVVERLSLDMPGSDALVDLLPDQPPSGPWDVLAYASRLKTWIASVSRLQNMQQRSDQVNWSEGLCEVPVRELQGLLVAIGKELWDHCGGGDNAR